MKRAAVFAALFVVFASFVSAQVVVHDAVPLVLTNEESSDIESFITFDPNNPRTIVISSSERADPMSTLGPLLVSFDGGDHWARRDVIPTCMGCWNTGDITISYDGSGQLFAAILSAISGAMQLLGTTDPTITTAMSVLSNTAGRDQPVIESRTVLGWFDPGKERAYVGNNIPSGTSNAKLDQTLDAVGSPALATVNLDARSPVVFDNYYIRPLIHADGASFGAFIRQLSSISGGANCELVLRRDNAWGGSSPAYENLSTSTGATVASFPMTVDFGFTYGGERVPGELALAIDPRDSQVVYASYASRVSSSNPTRLHLARSTTGGTSFTDILTVDNARLGAIAINSRGAIAYLYQHLTGTTGSRHWETHFQRSPDGTTWSDVILSDFPGEGAGAPPHDLAPYIGDYEKVIAVGKNFYGVFSASNDPATFPAGITYDRNIASGVLVRDDNTTPVAISMDPIFFRSTEMAADADVYVRDWTDSATSHDPGLEPSTHNAFYVTSDVWNRRSNDPQPFVNDAPQQEDPHPVAFGHNWAFTRVSREASGSAQSVNVEFLFSDGGVGTNFVSAGTTTLSLTAAEMQKTLSTGNGLQWDLPSGASNHVCLATQIWTGGDSYIGPTLAGRSPGWPNTDLDVINDNNKAQRNMHVFFGTSLGTGTSQIAVIHNASSSIRDMVVGLDFDPKQIRPRVRILGVNGPQPTFQSIEAHSTLTLPRMYPGESRWIEIAVEGAGGDRGESIVNLYELMNGRPLNGFAFIFRTGSLDDAIRNAMVEHGAIIARLIALGMKPAGSLTPWREPIAKENVAGYTQLVKDSLKGLRDRWPLLPGYKQTIDPFGIPAEIAALLKTDDVGTFVNRHLAFLNHLDAAISMTRDQAGNTADVAQMMRVQRELASKGRFKNVDLAALSDKFLRGYASPESYPSVVREALPILKEIATRSGDSSLIARYQLLGDAHDVQRIEGAHRAFLWRVEELEEKR